MLVKVRAEGEVRDEIRRVTEIFRGQIVDVGPQVFTIQLTGAAEKLDAFIAALEEGAILEVVRSGVVGISRGDKVLRL
jgi:acetolactate synthase-1/3 small subunit